MLRTFAERVIYSRITLNFERHQSAKKVVSDSPGLVDFAIGLVNSVLRTSEGFSENYNYRSTVSQMF